MNVQEQHIEVNLSSQKIASNINRKFDPSEIDWILNKMVERFIQDRIRKDEDSLGFDASQIDLDALRTLVIYDRSLPVYYKSTSINSVYANLPGDYYFLVSSNSGIVDNCNPSFKQSKTQVTGSEYIYKYPLIESVKDTAPYYQIIKFISNNSTVINELSLPGSPNTNELFTYREFIFDRLVQAGLNVYWEKYGSLFIKDNFLIVSTVQLITNSITIDAVTTNATELVQSISKVGSISNLKINANRLIKTQFRDNLLQSAFAGSKPTSPLSVVDNNSLRVYYDKRFTINTLSLTYIRKPAKISLLLSQNCDLAEPFHQQICDMTVLYIKELTMNPDWQIKLRDNMLNKN